MLAPDISAVKKAYAGGNIGSLPYWAATWPSAIALSIYLQHHPEIISQKRVLELAAGLGLPSLVAAAFAHSVYCTDMSAEAMDIAARSALLNGLTNMQCACINWNNIPQDLEADVLLLSDVNYDPEVFPALLQAMQSFLQRGTVIVLATPQRLMAKPFIEQLLPYCRSHEIISAALPGELLADISVLLLSA